MKLLLYCTKAKPYLEYKQIPRTLMEIDNSFEGYRCSYKRTEDDENWQLNGKIVAECDFEVVIEDTSYNCIDFRLSSSLDGISRLDKSCLTTEQLFDYVKGKNAFYAIHIKNLHIFDKPRELNFYMIYDKSYDNMFGWAFEEVEKYKPITKAPRNMMYVYDNGEKKILIPVTSEEMCRIANGEQTVLVRRTVLKEMIK